jgi:hypothetical protein
MFQGKKNKRLELIDNKGDQKFILSIPLYFGKRKILQYTYGEPKHDASEL